MAAVARLFLLLAGYLIISVIMVVIFSLGACKAFDRTNHFALFACMLRKGIPKYIFNIFIAWHRNLSCHVRWAEGVSHSFPILSGLPQGIVLSFPDKRHLYFYHLN